MWKCWEISSLAIIFYVPLNENWLDRNFRYGDPFIGPENCYRSQSDECLNNVVPLRLPSMIPTFPEKNLNSFNKYLIKLKSSTQSNFGRDLFKITWHHLAINIHFKSWNNPRASAIIWDCVMIIVELFIYTMLLFR